ncbi:MAG: MBL fold metallo-hydrolase [Youngiibacter sp.]|nr:MBL fold metallo-hydrolase [Youngiibacter sp.]
MLIKVLMDNESLSGEFLSEHGLSLYIETGSKKILFDTGESGAFEKNAEKLGVDISLVDYLVISHGHYDHGGGIRRFLELNTRAKVFISRRAFGEHWTVKPDGSRKYIGLDRSLIDSGRIVPVEDYHVVDDGIELFSGIKGDRLTPSGNQDLYMIHSGELVNDDFAHEQNMLITEDGKGILFAGCAHRGIVNIIEEIAVEGNILLDSVIGGFHLYNKSRGTSESDEIVDEIGRYLKESGPKYYTCHCTGLEAYGRLKETMDGKLDYLAAGRTIEI